MLVDVIHVFPYLSVQPLLKGIGHFEFDLIPDADQSMKMLI